MSDHPAELLAGSSGNSLHIWRVKDVSSSPCLPSTRPGSLELGVVAWNRNNKVVAGARSDGSVVLSYSSGEPMSTLRPASATGRPGGVADSLPVAMAWGAGSKRLAVGLRSGELHVHDMMTKAVSAFPISPLGVVDLHYHPTDRFLALTTSDAAHLLDRDLNQIGRLPLDPGNVTATSLDSQGTGLVAGSARGTVQLWDLRLRRSRGTWEEARGSSLAVRAVAGSPAQPAVWYVASRAGTIWTLDDRVPTTGTSVVRLGAPVTAFSLKENGAAFAAGTRDGAVYLYDPRRAEAPLMTLASGDYEPISSLHWQRCYIQAPQRAPVAEPSAERAERGTAQNEGGSESGAGHPPRAASALQLDRPLDLSVTPMLRPSAASAASQRRAAELAPFSFSSSSERLSASAAALEDIRRRLPLVGGSAAAEQGRRAAAEPSTEQPRRAAAEPAAARPEPPPASPARPTPSSALERVLSPTQPRAARPTPLPKPLTAAAPPSPARSPLPLPPQKRTVPALRDPADAWRIRAVAPHAELGAQAAEPSPSSTARSIDSVGPRVEAEEPRAPRSPSLALKTQSLGPNTISRDDLLALHLDMLNQFEAQRDHMTSVVEDLVQRNEGLAADLAGLRGLFQELLAQRRGADWL